MAFDPTQGIITIPQIVSVDEFNAYIRPTQKVPTDYQREMVEFALRQATQYLNTFLNNKIVNTIDTLDPNSDRDKARIQHLKMAIIYVAEYFLIHSRIFASMKQSMSGSTPFAIERDSFTAIVESERPDIINELNAGGGVSTFYSKSLSKSDCENLEGQLINYIQNYLYKNYLPLYDALKHPLQSDIDMNYHKIINYELSGYVENINIINPQGLINIEKLESTDKKNIDFLLTTTLLKDIDINNTDGSIRVEKVGSPRNNKVFFNISSTFKNGLSFKGSVDTFNDLPTTNLEIGDVYLVKDVMLFYCGDGNEGINMGNTTSGIKDIDAGQDIIIDKTTTPEIPIINFNRQGTTQELSTKANQTDIVNLQNLINGLQTRIQNLETNSMLCVYSKDNPSNHVADLIPQEYRHSGYIAFIQGRSQNDGSGWTTDAEITIVAMITETYIALQSPIGGTTTNSCAFVCFAPWDETPTNTKHVEQNANFSKNAEIWGHIGANNSSNFHGKDINIHRIDIYKKGI